MILLQDPERKEWECAERTEPGLLSFLLSQFLPWACPGHPGTSQVLQVLQSESNLAQRNPGSSPGSTGPKALRLAISDLFSHLTNRHAPTAHQEVTRFTEVAPRCQHRHANIWTDSSFKFGSWKSETAGTKGISCAAWIQLVHQCLVSGGHPDIEGGGAEWWQLPASFQSEPRPSSS